MLTTAKKERLTYTLILHILLIIGTGLAIYFYVIPGFKKINTDIASANATIAKYNSLEGNGIVFSDLETVLAGKDQYLELQKMIQADPAEAESALVKGDSTAPYLDWISAAIRTSGDAKAAIVRQKADMNSILPTLSPAQGGDNDYLTLKKYIQYIESNIFKQFSFAVISDLGLESVSFDSTESGLPENVGTFDLQFNFEANNGDILDFIDFIRTSGEPSALLKEENTSETMISPITGTDTTPEILSNALITLSSLSLESTLDPENRGYKNSGSATIRFYVRGGSQTDIAYLVGNIAQKTEDIGKAIAEALQDCENSPTACSGYITKLKAFEVKYREFIRSTVNQNNTETTNIQFLSNQSSVIKALENELYSMIPTKTAK